MTGQELKLLRVHMKLTQNELAKNLGVTHPTISNWEKKGVPKLAQLAIERYMERFKDICNFSLERWREYVASGLPAKNVKGNTRCDKERLQAYNNSISMR